jgi:DNA-binding transcriptional MerR regulator
LTLHRRELLQATTLSGGGLDFYAQKKVVLRTRKRPTQQWIYAEDTAQRIKVAQELGQLGISLDDAAAALNSAPLHEIEGQLATQPADRAGEWVDAIITRAAATPEIEEPAAAS